jgi:hypothetical protein
MRPSAAQDTTTSPLAPPPSCVTVLAPAFYWRKVEPYIRDGIRYPQRRMEERQWVAQLHSHVFAVEHGQRSIGPEAGAPS